MLTADTGAMADDLPAAIARALTLDRTTCAAAGARFTWPASARQFLDALEPFDMGLSRAA